MGRRRERVRIHYLILLLLLSPACCVGWCMRSRSSTYVERDFMRADGDYLL